MPEQEPQDAPIADTDAGTPADAPADAPAERARRLADLDELRAGGVDPYPVRFDRTCTLAELRAEHGGLEAGADSDAEVRVAGRIMLLRRQGKLTFATIKDQDGNVQLFVSRAVLGEEQHTAFDDLDLGDWVGVEGTVMATRKGELSVKVTAFQLLAKALRPLPDKWHGLSDVDTRFRQRYVDLIVNDDARRVFAVRFAAVASLRRSLADRGFVEVETPVLEHELGGATARPFHTHHNALDVDLFLRIALELHLKRLVVGGFERVFEIGRVFRNEGIDTSHNPEFTMLEAYQAFGDYHDMMELTEHLVVEAARAANGTTEVEIRGETVDLAEPWPKATMVDLVREHVGVEIHPGMDVAAARAVLDGLGLTYQDAWGAGRLTHEVYDARVEDELVRPTFVLDHPRETSPLARVHRDDPNLVERFEVVAGGNELANAYSELNDPIDQRARFEIEAAARAAGDAEAGTIDEDYLRALEHGLPPTGGLGIGIDRLTMLLAGVTSIREVILFPTLRPEAT
jgi:lysyl-tRNA synthetase class 2